MHERLELARRLGDAENVALSLLGIGLLNHSLGNAEQALAAASASAELARAGGYTWVLALDVNNLALYARDRGDYAQARAHLEESLELFRQLGSERDLAGVVCSLGELAAREGRQDEAEALLRESLERAHALVDMELAIWCLEPLAGLAVSTGDGERAARLMGVVETLRAETGHVALPEDRRASEQTSRALVTELGEERHAAAVASGREMTLEQAVAYALESESRGAEPGWLS